MAELENKLLDFYKSEGIFDEINQEERRLNSNIIKKDINPVVVEDMYEKNDKEIKILSTIIKNKLTTDNPYINKVYKYIAEYGDFLDISDQINKNSNFIFTSDLKSLSGANLHLLSFCFKLGLKVFILFFYLFYY